MRSLVGNVLTVILRAKPEESPYIETLRFAQSDEHDREFTISNYAKRILHSAERKVTKWYVS